MSRMNPVLLLCSLIRKLSTALLELNSVSPGPEYYKAMATQFFLNAIIILNGIFHTVVA